MSSAVSHHPLTLGRVWWLLRRDVERGFTATWHDRVTSSQILNRCRPLPKSRAEDSFPPVHVLAGEEQWLMTVWMLASWLHHTGRPWNVHVHDDGTLSDTAVAELTRLFEGITIVRRAVANEEMTKALAAFPLCAAYRDAHPLGIKCFDIPHMARGNRFILLDSDVLFFRQPAEMLSWAADDSDNSSWFNQDPQEPSSLSSEQCRQDLGFKLWPRVNSGLCMIAKDAIDFSSFERWLELDSIKNGIAWRTEQTLLALGASRTGRGGLLPKHYEVTLGVDALRDGIARHYVGSVRNRFYAEGIRGLRGTLLR